jgi:CubicO group peptidase (beta-lactamase class C family)
MVPRNIVRWLAVFVLLALFGWRLPAQEVRRGGPPPEIRALVDAFVNAMNGSADAWEAMAKERFSAAYLKARPAADRKKLYDSIKKDLGEVTFERAVREGPEAPLQLHVRGSTGATGTITLEIDATTPPKISGVTANVGGTANAGAESTPPLPISGRMSTDELTRALDDYLARLTAADAFSGVVLVAKGETAVYHQAFGLADRGNKIANSTRTRFNLGSINKAFTRMAIDQLVAAGRLAYTDTVGKFFPDYPQEATRAATVEQLLSHRGGIADFFGPEFAASPKDRFRSNADYFDFISKRPPLFAPGARNQYCNGCYITLGAIVERVSGMPYERYVAEHIFKAADMSATGYPHADAIEADVAIGYTRRSADGQLRSNVYLHGATGSAAGGGYSTASDLLAFVNAVRQGKLPSQDRDGLGIAGGAPGINAIIESDSAWTVIVLANVDPPAAQQLGVAMLRALR